MTLRARPILRLLVVSSLLGALQPVTGFAGEPLCQLGAYSLALGGDAAALQARLAARRDPVIVAIGSSSTGGAGASDADHSYPAQLKRLLARKAPTQNIQVINRGINGEEAADMVRRFGADIFALSPDLVIWQLGTNYLMRNEGVGRYGETLRDGIDRLRSAGVKVILMDPQYAPRVLADPDHEAIVRLIAETAREKQVALFPRFRLMQSWIQAGTSWAQILAPDMLHLNDLSYGCIAEALASELAPLNTTGK